MGIAGIASAETVFSETLTLCCQQKNDGFCIKLRVYGWYKVNCSEEKNMLNNTERLKLIISKFENSINI